MSNKKVILYLAGGGMSGVFSGGVLTALQDFDIYDRIEKVYASSAGAINACYFLTRNSKVGASIYYENLTDGFISYENVLPGALQRLFMGKKYPEVPEECINVMHVDYLFDIMAKKKKLNVTKLRKQPIPFLVKVYNQDKKKIEIHRIGGEDSLKILRASICATPYTYEFEEINGDRMVDSDRKEVIGLDRLLREEKGKKIVVIVNRPIRNIAISKTFCILEGMLASWQSGPESFAMPFTREKNFRRDFGKALGNKDVLLIYPDRKRHKVTAKTKKAKHLRKSFELGKESAKRIVEFISA